MKTLVVSKKTIGGLCLALLFGASLLWAQQPQRFNRRPINNPYKVVGDFVEGNDAAILNAKAKVFEVALYQDAEYYQFRVLSMRTKGALRQAEVEMSWK